MEQPEFQATGSIRLLQPPKDMLEAGVRPAIIIGAVQFTIDPDKEYDVEISERRPKVYEEIAQGERANSGTHYQVLHRNGDPVDPAAKCFVLRLDNPCEHSARAYVAYAASLKAAGRVDEAERMIGELPERFRS